VAGLLNLSMFLGGGFIVAGGVRHSIEGLWRFGVREKLSADGGCDGGDGFCCGAASCGWGRDAGVGYREKSEVRLPSGPSSTSYVP
jgi:hypothetical protein